MNVTDDRIQAILKGRRALRVVEVPGFAGVNVALRILLDAEIDDARVEAARYIAKRARESGFDPQALLAIEPELLDREKERQIIFRASFDADSDPEKPRPFFPSEDHLRAFDSVSVRALFEAYVEHQEWVSPRASLTDEEVESLFDALGKEQIPGVTLANFERSTLERCVRSLVRRLRSS